MTEANKKSEIAEMIHADDAAENQDAQLMAEAIETGMAQAPDFNVADDYEASKLFSVNPQADTEEGAKAIAEATAPQFEVPEPEDILQPSDSSGDPADFRDMAKDVGVGSGESVITDDLVQKALEMGQPGS